VVNDKLIKSFVVLKDFEEFKKGDVLTMKRHQATIPLVNDLIMFESQSNGKNLSLHWLLQNNYTKVKPLDFFGDNREKFEHIT
jgi:hypothetical protein